MTTIEQILEKKHEIIEINNQLEELYGWFSWYDIQVMQYNRDIRLFNSSNINIVDLDYMAQENASKINELRSEILSKSEEISTLESILGGEVNA